MIMTTQARSRWSERLSLLAPIVLAVLVLCSGCSMLFAFALTSQGELEASILGSEWRVWQLDERGTNGIGVSQSSAFMSGSGQTCQHIDVWLLIWQPRVMIEKSGYDDCGVAGYDSSVF